MLKGLRIFNLRKMYDSLYNSLHSLYLKASEKIIAARNEGLLLKIPYERINARNLDFKMGHTSFQYDYDNIIYFDYYDWSTDNFISFMDNEMKKLPEFETAAEEICKAFDISEENKRFAKDIGLFGFVRLLMKQIPNGRITSANIDAYIKTFIGDYETYKSDNLFTWHIQAWLGNFHFESENIQIDNFTLRKPIVEELYISRQRSHHIEEFNKMLGRSLFSTSILEFSIRAPKQIIGLYSDEIRHEIENCLDVFRLFKIGNVTVTHLSVNPTSILEYGHNEAPESPFDKSWKDKIEHQHTSNYECWVQKEAEPQLVTFFQNLKPILENISPKNYLSGNYLDLAFHRYKDSLLRSEVNVNRMVSAITCLEALLSNSSSEITYKISIHVAELLRHFGFETIPVFEKMKTAYNIRSKLLHGSELDEKLLNFSKNHSHEIINYARICLLTSLQLKTKFSKDSLIKKIDYSLINDKEYKELGEVIKESVFIPVIYPFRNIPGGDEFIQKL